MGKVFKGKVGETCMIKEINSVRRVYSIFEASWEPNRGRLMAQVAEGGPARARHGARSSAAAAETR